MVGNGKKFTFSTAATSKVSICLDLDSNIAQDAITYPIRDFVLVSGTTLGVPLKVNVTKSGTQYCGSVDPFTSATFMPVLRKDVSIIQTTTTVATTTTSGGTGGTTSSGGVGGTTTSGGVGGTTTSGGVGGTTTSGGVGGTTTSGGVGGTTTTITSTTTTFSSTTGTATTTTTTSSAHRPSFSITMIFLAVFLLF